MWVILIESPKQEKIIHLIYIWCSPSWPVFTSSLRCEVPRFVQICSCINLGRDQTKRNHRQVQPRPSEFLPTVLPKKKLKNARPPATIINIMQAHLQSLATAAILMPLLFTLSVFTGASLLIVFLFFLLLSLLLLFFFFLLFFFLYFNLKIPGRSSLSLLPLPKYGKIITGSFFQLCSPKFPHRRHKWHIRFEVWQYCISFQEKRKGNTQLPPFPDL